MGGRGALRRGRTAVDAHGGVLDEAGADLGVGRPCVRWRRGGANLKFTGLTQNLGQL